MSNVIEFTLPVPPLVNQNHKPTKDGGIRKDEKARAYQKGAGWLIYEQLGTETVNAFHDLDKPLSVTLRWYRGARRGDVDGVAKVTLDAMQGVVYKDDKVICHLEIFRFEDKKNPRLEVVVKEWVA